MKILYINALDKRYGSTYRSRNIVKALIGLGYEVKYVESNLEGRLFENNLSIFQNDNLFGYFIATYHRVVLALKLDYDILFLQKFTPLTVPCLIIGKLRRKRCIVDWDDLDWALQGSFVKKVLVFICEFVFPYFADKITTHSLLLKEYTQNTGVKNVFIVNQVVDFDKIEVIEEEKKAIREKYNLKGKKVLGYLCTLTEGGARDIDVIIRWARELIKKDNSFFLLIIGGGPLENRVRNLLTTYDLRLTTNCAITGLIPHQDVKKILSVCEIGLIYMRDNLGNRMRVSFKVLECLASSVPVVGFLVGESKDRFSKACFLCRDDDFDFQQKVINVLNNLKQRESLKENNVLGEYNFNDIKLSLREIINVEDTD